MRFPVIPLVCMALLIRFPLSGEEVIDTETPERAETSGDGPVFFPVYALLSALRTPDLRWQPDWPVTMPPDAFITGHGRPRSITLLMDSEVWRVTRNQNEVPADFPFLFQGNFVQVHADFEESGGLRGLTIEDSLRPWTVDFIEGDDPALWVTRITQGEEVFFGVIQNASAGDIETWYDRDGNPLMVFTYLFRPDGRGLLRINSGGETPEEYYQDSFGNTSKINALQGVFSAGYTMDGRPRYWERRVPADSEGEEPVPPEIYQFYTFQWDEGGFLVRLTGTPGSGEGDPVDFRYDYTLDERGNWIERQEIRMIPRFGMLVPSPGSRIIRKIEYEPED